MGLRFRIEPGHALFRTYLERPGERVAIREQGRNVRLESSQPLIESGAIDHLRTVVAGKKTAMV
jgi:hypothetical protein